MQLKSFKALATGAVALVALVSSAQAHDKVAAEMAQAAKGFLEVLDAKQKGKTQYAFGHEERKNWHFIPKERNGLQLRHMTDEQKEKAMALVNTGLSERGLKRVESIRAMEEYLYETESAHQPEEKRQMVRERRHPLKYHVTIFGEPSMKGAWGWRFEGHHLSLNYTVNHGHLVRMAPHFYGSNPGEVREGPKKGLRILGEEEEAGRAFATSLNAEQWKKALVSETAYPDVITLAEKEVKPLEPSGLSEKELTKAQKKALHELVKVHLFRSRPEVAEMRWKEIQSEGPIHFAWAGSLKPGEGHYYRIQGESFLVEYDNTQNNANHIHAVWREFKGDFGGDILRDHLEKDHGVKMKK